MSGLEVILATGTLTTTARNGTVVATCPTGKRVLGGGGDFTIRVSDATGAPQNTIFASFPSTNVSGGFNQWTVRAFNNTLSDRELRVWAICASVAP
ncbi:hypothetical protein [Roseisolibacter sp. H3M3-2]|uniref:hypothetical protein n=1 Tax=Roseisolibacter sp. H3M3-2 TaxID=3031323 RepID=UPI0023DBFFF7|nr:hypothetical protein [Roseisolibacter sp. H3M3-2]MDF1504626.1 hypothetical protein [Roseisolibacter sp. H3M3-2]